MIGWKSRNFKEYKISKLKVNITQINGTNELWKELEISDQSFKTCKKNSSFYH
jgi:hypothetical protein